MRRQAEHLRLKDTATSTPYLVLAVSLLVTLAAWMLVGRIVAARDSDRFEAAVGDTEDAIRSGIDSRVVITQATASFIAANPNATKQSFREFLARMGWPQSNPAVGSVGYSVHIPIGQVNAFMKRARSLGVTNLRIEPFAGSKYLDASLFSEPFNPNAPPPGFDMHSLPDRADAMDKARDLGEPVASAKLFLLSDQTKSRPAFIVCVPLYKTVTPPATVEERQRTLKGYATCSFRVKESLAPIFTKKLAPQCTVEIFDGSEGTATANLLYNNTPVGRDDRFHKRQTLEIMHRTWTVIYTANEEFVERSGEDFVPWLIPFGVGISVLLFFLTLQQSKVQAKLAQYAIEAERRAVAQSLLARAGNMLGSSLDFRSTFAEVARLAVPTFADWCSVDILAEDGSIQRLAVAHDDPEKVAWAVDLHHRFPPDPKDSTGVPNVLRTGKAELYPTVPPEMIDQSPIPEEEKNLIRDLHITSALMVPIKARGKTLGVLSFLWAESGNHFSEDDLRLAEEVAERSGLAMDNSLLFASAQQELAERTRAEETVRKLNDELEQLVEERTGKLRIAVEELEAFCYSVSHDLRAPLRSVDGFSKAVLDDYSDKLDEDAIDALQRVRAAARRMDELITSLLTLSRLTRADINPDVVDLSDLARQVSEDYDPKHAIEWIIQPGLTVLADPPMLRALIDNLIGNAVKFSGKVPHPKVEVGESDGTYFVRDNGAGFDPLYSSKLFQPFERLHTAREFPGSGIGLATAERIVRRHGGEIWGESKVNEGATFYFTLGTHMPSN